LILADEPTGNLDTGNGEQVMRLLSDLNREMGVTIILATHSEEAALYTRRVIHMRDGLIERERSGAHKLEAQKLEAKKSEASKS
jgi:putative ABC transport system ATP-binding protein